jgi:hypothetical protein
MIGVGVSENQMFELIWRPAKHADRLEDRRLLSRVTGVDQGQTIVPLD